MASALLSGLGNFCMIDALFNNPNYLAGKKVLDAIALRQEAIASNIANLETPGYQRVDLAPSFKSELQRACAAANPAQIIALKPSLAPDPNAVPNSLDGNTVSFEHEILQLQQNMLAHTIETQIVGGALQKIKLAIGGK